MPKRILLTGASGFFGSHLLRHLLLNTDWEIVCICSWQHKGTPERIKNALMVDGKYIYKDRVSIITHDLNAPIPEMTKRRIGKVDYILNIASNSHVGDSIVTPVLFVQENVNVALNMLEFAREVKPEVFLQFSTDEVYGPAPEGIDFEEWSPIIPSNPYSASKACQEAIAISYWRTYNIPVIITNTMNIYGQTQDAQKYLAQVIRKVSNGEKITIHGDENNIGSRHWIHARNAADAVLYILNNLPPSLYKEDEVMKPDRYNIVGEIELNNLELAQKVADIIGKPLWYEFEGFDTARPGHDKRYALSGKKLALLGWQPPKTFDESLRSTVEWTLQNPIWL